LLTGLLVFLLLSFALRPDGSAAAEIRIDGQLVAAGQTLQVPIVVDGADDLAGVKIVLRYDPGQLAYRGTARAEAAGHMMHVVNDKQPGTLIIVMAGATGIQAENLALFTLTFDVAASLAKGAKIALRITESQLMSAQLKDIAHKVVAKTLVVEEATPK
jgi:hypothetical protein